MDTFKRRVVIAFRAAVVLMGAVVLGVNWFLLFALFVLWTPLLLELIYEALLIYLSLQ
jgi:hypothetical protein